jgi:hypothetical protein
LGLLLTLSLCSRSNSPVIFASKGDEFFQLTQVASRKAPQPPLALPKNLAAIFSSRWWCEVSLLFVIQPSPQRPVRNSSVFGSGSG